VDSGYFNFYSRVAESWWDRREFLHRWWRLYAGDRRWAPPHYPTLYAALVAGRVPHVTRQQPALVHVEALHGRARRNGEFNRPLSTPLMEEPVAAAVVMADRRRRDGIATLGLLACANDEESLERLLAVAQEQAWRLGCSQLVGPAGLSPHLNMGALHDHFDLQPPLHTSYNPPYLPEVLHAVMVPLHTARLYTARVALPAGQVGPAQLLPLAPQRLAGDLLPLLATGMNTGLDTGGLFPPPDGLEAAFLVAWWGVWPLRGWVAEVDGQAVGFVLLQPDLAGPVRWAKGGRSLLRRPWLAWRSRRPVRAGRVLAGGVLPAWRGRGIGTQLWRQAIAYATEVGWRDMTIGPLDPAGPGASFLTARGAIAQQSYTLFSSEG
jgi:GNAT superfamily N-acetyltransferase